MKVFMSWSGQRSKLTAELLHEWIKCVIQAAQPWISSKGIERGALWFSEINNELQDTSVGIVCLTPENKNAPWILFEAGALAKGLSTNRVCTFLIELKPTDLQPPLAQFNHTFPEKDSMWSLVTTLNSGLELNQLDLKVLKNVFDTYWPQFEKKFAAIINENPPTTVVEPREDKDILTEILETTRSMSNRVSKLEARTSSLLPPDRQIFKLLGALPPPSTLRDDENTHSNVVESAIKQIKRGNDVEFIVSSIQHNFGYSEADARAAINWAQMAIDVAKSKGVG